MLGARQPGGLGEGAVHFRGFEAASTNLEYKPADASCNPYLAFGGLIAAGLDGHGARPGAAPTSFGRPGHDERGGTHRRRRGASTPPIWPKRSSRLEDDAVLTDALGDVLARSYLSVRRSEWEA